MIWGFEVPAWFSVRSKTVIVLYSWNWFSSKSYRFFSSYFVTYPYLSKSNFFWFNKYFQSTSVLFIDLICL